MRPSRLLPALGLATAALVQAAPAQQGSVYINQIDRAVAAPDRRSVAAQTVEQSLLDAATGNAGRAAGAQGLPGPSSVDPFGDPSSSVRGLPPAGPSGNTAVLNQIGAGNAGTITQTGQGNAAIATIYGGSNVTSQIQSGNGSASNLTLYGSGNTVGTAQTGDNNSSTLSVSGQRNVVSNSQTGNNLNYGLTVVGRDASISVVQTNTGPAAVVVPSTATPLPVAPRR